MSSDNPLADFGFNVSFEKCLLSFPAHLMLFDYDKSFLVLKFEAAKDNQTITM